MVSNMSAIEILNMGDDCREKPWLNKYWPFVLGVPFGFGSQVFINFTSRRPYFSGIQKHILAAAAFSAIFYAIQSKRDEYLAEKDAVLRHYIQLHPEDFCTPERKKIADIFEPWIPVR